MHHFNHFKTQNLYVTLASILHHLGSDLVTVLDMWIALSYTNVSRAWLSCIWAKSHSNHFWSLNVFLVLTFSGVLPLSCFSICWRIDIPLENLSIEFHMPQDIGIEQVRNGIHLNMLIIVVWFALMTIFSWSLIWVRWAVSY